MHVRRFSKMFHRTQLFISVIKHIFIWVDMSTIRTFANGLTPIQENCIKGLCSHLKSQRGVQFPPLELLALGILREHFPEHLISIRDDLEGPTHPPNLAPCDFSMGSFEIPHLCQPSKDPTRPEGHNTGRNCQLTRYYTAKGHDKHQKSFSKLCKTMLYLFTYIMKQKSNFSDS